MPFLASALSFDALLALVPFVLLLLVGVTLLVHVPGGGDGTLDPQVLFHRFLPAHDSTPGRDPLEPVERLLASILRNREQLSLVVVPTFLWFSTRLFASMRNALNLVYDVHAEPVRSHGILGNYVRNKGRDMAVALLVVALFLADLLLSAGLAVIRSRGEALGPSFAFFVGEAGRVVTGLLALVFSVTLFYVMYRFASPRRLGDASLLVAAAVAALGYEVAKRLFGVYLARTILPATPWSGGPFGALILFVLWLYYMAIVFLVGGVVAERWEARRLHRRQQALLA
ncbi:MAG: YihY/virulence factor BrkB family protein [Gemmatimonadales bacterium]|nr:YihY/virulence factor BrkB family protein [Gemmatimonadales bacterium]